MFIKIAAIRAAFCYLHSLFAFGENSKNIEEILKKIFDIIKDISNSDVKEATAMYLTQFCNNCINKDSFRSVWFLDIVLPFLLKNFNSQSLALRHESQNCIFVLLNMSDSNKQVYSKYLSDGDSQTTKDLINLVVELNW